MLLCWMDFYSGCVGWRAGGPPYPHHSQARHHCQLLFEPCIASKTTHKLPVEWLHNGGVTPLLSCHSQHCRSHAHSNIFPLHKKQHRVLQGPTVPLQKFKWLLGSCILLWTAQAICTAKRGHRRCVGLMAQQVWGTQRDLAATVLVVPSAPALVGAMASHMLLPQC